MKYLAFIFTLYVVALSAWPCCGSEAGLATGQDDACYSSTEHHNAQEDPHACSPFFHSSTYHAFVASPAVNKAPALVISEYNNSFPDFQDCAVILFSGDIWQPPQWV